MEESQELIEQEQQPEFEDRSDALIYNYLKTLAKDVAGKLIPPRPKTGIPQWIRLVRRPYTYGDIEIEFIYEGENQGKIVDVPYVDVIRWLKVKQIPDTLTLHRAYDACWNFGQAIYMPKTDEMVIPNE